MMAWTLTSVGAVLLTALAYRAGLLRGRSAERAVVNRFLHDTVLPTLDAVALDARPETARAHAAELRRGLGRPAVRTGLLGAELAALVADVAREGLHARLELEDNGAGLAMRSREALRDATGEALRNTMRHARTDRAVVRVERRAGGVAVITSDHGIGFDQTTRRPGFGIAESIVARMAEVGGQVDIQSRPGWGTRVCLWVPR